MACYPFLIDRYRAEGFSPAVEALMTMAAEGYPFPGNLDKTQPVNGLAPPSQRDLLHDALAGEWSTEQVSAALAEQLMHRTS